MRNEMGYYFEDYIEGDLIVHSKSKTIFESDNNLFSLLTMNHHPVHINTQYALTSQHKEILVVGTLVFSLVVGLTVSDISGKAIANLSYDKIIHKEPVFIGDTIYSIRTNMEKRPKYLKMGLVRTSYEVFKGEGELVLYCEHLHSVKYKEPDNFKDKAEVKK